MFWVIAILLVLVALSIPTLAIFLNSPVIKGYFHGTDPVKLGEVIDRIRAIEDEMSQMGMEIEDLKDESRFVQKLLDNPSRPPELPNPYHPHEPPTGPTAE